MSSVYRQVLILNATYEAINIVSARRAVHMVLRGKADVVQPSPYVIRTSRMNVPVPSVVKLRHYARVPRQTRAVSRKGILLRDGNTCQYCNHTFPAKTLTMDHVFPKSRGGEPTWENLVACCFECNNRKGDRTPQEAGMQLARRPRQVTLHMKHRMMVPQGDTSWDKYLFC